MKPRATPVLAILHAGFLAGCAPNYFPDTYASRAAQQANKVEQGLLVGVRPVRISADASNGGVTGSAAGGIAGSETATGAVAAFVALGGAVVGGVAGSAIEHTVGDVRAYEYVVRKSDGELLSVAQQDHAALVLGEKVLVIAGPQARVVPDYTVALAPSPPAVPAEVAARPAPVAAEALPRVQPALPP